MGPLYVVTERFDPTCGDGWQKYIAWSGLRQLVEVVSLDSSLCPPVVRELRDDDWPHVVAEDYMTSFFTDLEHLLARCGDAGDHNVLCVFRNPTTEPSPPAGFRYLGHDVVDVCGDVSALTNCGGFPLAFSNDELSEHGLLPSLERARAVQADLRRQYPDERHADCHVWSIFRRP